MKSCSIVCSYKPDFTKKLNGTIIGCDKGAFYLIENGYIPDVSIGDFDSCSKEEKEIIKNKSKKYIELNSIKDDTDLEHVLNYIKDYNFDLIEVYGCLGGRQDHNLMNLKFCYMSSYNLVMYGRKDKVFSLKKGSYNIYKDGYKYLSLFNFEDVIVNLSKVKYPINCKMLDLNNNFSISNEIEGDYCELDIIKGRLLVIQSND